MILPPLVLPGLDLGAVFYFLRNIPMDPIRQCVTLQKARNARQKKHSSFLDPFVNYAKKCSVVNAHPNACFELQL